MAKRATIKRTAETPGRPRSDPAKRIHGHAVMLWLTNDDYKTLKSWATEEGRPVSQLVRCVLLAEMAKREERLARHREQLAQLADAEMAA